MTSPTSVGSGTYFSKIFVSAEAPVGVSSPNGRAENKVPSKKPLYIQSPKCKTRQGIVQSGKKIHADLVFTNDDEEFIQWMESLEQTVKKNIYNNRGKWFDMDMDEDDVDSYMTPTMKIFKSGKQYLMRVNVSQRIGTAPLKIYDEDEVAVEMSAINDTTSIITILEIQGVRCSSKSFQIDIELKQIMVLKPVNLFERCIIKSRDRPLERPLEKQVSPPQTDPIVENVVLKPVAEEPVAEEPVAEEPVAEEHVAEEPVEESIHIEIEDDNTLAKNIDIEEFDLNIDTIENTDTVQLKEKTEVYYQMYREAKQKAKLAKSLALSSYMEARRIKNLYMLDDVDSSDDEDFELE
jgi:hypothetical protein